MDSSIHIFKKLANELLLPICKNLHTKAKQPYIQNTTNMITQLDEELLQKLRSKEKLLKKVPSTPSKRFWLRIDRSSLWKGR